MNKTTWASRVGKKHCEQKTGNIAVRDIEVIPRIPNNVEYIDDMIKVSEPFLMIPGIRNIVAEYLEHNIYPKDYPIRELFASPKLFRNFHKRFNLRPIYIQCNDEELFSITHHIATEHGSDRGIYSQKPVIYNDICMGVDGSYWRYKISFEYPESHLEYLRNIKSYADFKKYMHRLFQDSNKKFNKYATEKEHKMTELYNVWLKVLGPINYYYYKDNLVI